MIEKILKEIGFEPQVEKLILDKLKTPGFLEKTEEIYHKIFDGDSPAEDAGMWLEEGEEKGFLYTAAYLLRFVWLKEYMEKAGMPEKHMKDALRVFRDVSERNYSKYGFYGLSGNYRSFPYSVAKPTRFVVGRLTYEMGTFSSPFEVYEADGKYIPVALAGERFVKGKPVSKKYKGDVFVTDFSETDGIVCGYTYDHEGLIIAEKCTFKGKKVLANGDRVLHVHINSEGKLLDEDVKKSFKMAPEFFAKYFPEFDFKAFVCSSWLLDTGLKNVMKPESNILQFQKNFRIALGSENGFALYWNIFGIEDFLPIDQLVPANGFQQRVLDYIKAGNKLYSGKGFIIC